MKCGEEITMEIEYEKIVEMRKIVWGLSRFS